MSFQQGSMCHTYSLIWEYKERKILTQIYKHLKKPETEKQEHFQTNAAVHSVNKKQAPS
jgi:hypothetical protein